MTRRKISFPKITFFQLIFILIALTAAFVFWFIFSTRPADSQNLASQIIVISPGESIDTIANKLKTAKLIRSPAAFKLTVVKQGLAQDLQAGAFRLNPSMNTSQIAQQLTHGTLDIWVTLLEGWRREEMAAAINKEFTTLGAEFNQQEFLTLTRNDEGYLFPDTYLFPRDASVTTIISIIKNNFDNRLTDALRTEIQRQDRTLNKVIIVASLVEREARNSSDRPLVAGILWKRLEANWPLQVDATIQYALGYDQLKDTWWPQPTVADKSINSLFNTYQNRGLPPTPICNPSLDALKAAIYPQKSDYWFYLSDTNGTMHYAKTIEQHDANINRYLN
jgi:UPF0755 protein